MTKYDNFFIGGEWVKPHGSQVIDVTAAHTGKTFAQVPLGNAEDVDAAIAAARRAFDEGSWSKAAPADRATVLERFAEIIESRSGEFASFTSTQNGSLLSSNSTINVPWGVGILRYYANMVRDFKFEEPRDPGMTAEPTVYHLPIGVVVAIVPFNTAFIQALAKIGPALAAGCTVILKPSAAAPLEAFGFAQAAEAAGFPPGVINVITAARDAAGDLMASRDVNHVSFTGSTPVGRNIAHICADQLKTCSLELGGNAAAVVLDDAPMEKIIPGLLGLSVMLNNGQACIGQCRILVHKDQYDAYAAALANACKGLKVGDPADPTVQVGPMVSEAHRKTVMEYIEIGKQEGAELLAGGGIPENLPEELKDGYFVEPTVFANVANEMRICQEEIFGPVITLTSYEDDEDAIAKANGQPFGLSSSVWGSPERAVGVAKRIIAGSVYVNGAFSVGQNVPFGGLKDSGIGNECGPEGLHEYLQEQVIYTPKAP